MKSSDTVLSAILGAALFLVSLIILKFALVIALVIGAVGFGCGLVCFKTKSEAEISKDTYFEDNMKAGYDKLAILQKLCRNITSSLIKSKVEMLCETLEKCLVEIRRDPSDMARAKEFLGYHVDSTIKIIESYIQLYNTTTKDASVKKSIAKIEETLDMLVKFYEKQYATLLSNDVMNVDVEISMLENAIKSTGMNLDDVEIDNTAKKKAAMKPTGMRDSWTN